MTTNRKPTVEELEASLAHERREQSRRIEQQLDPADCALSSWASGLTSRLDGVKLDLAAQGWRAFFPVLVKDGQPVPAKLFQGRFGWCWGLVGENDRFSGFVGCRAGVSKVTKKMEREGYDVSWVEADANARLYSPPGTRGFSTNVWPVITRDSDGNMHGRLSLDGPED